MNWQRYPNWFNSNIFKELYKLIYDEYFDIIKISLEPSTIIKKYGKKFDKFAFGMTLAYLIHKNDLSWLKYEKLVKSLISLKSSN